MPEATRTVVLTNPAYAGWQLTGFGTTSQFGVTVAFSSARGPSHPAKLVATYAPWQLIKECDIAGVCLLIVAGGLLAISVIRFSRARWKPDSR